MSRRSSSAYASSTPAPNPAGGSPANTCLGSTPSHIRCMPPSGSHTDMAMNVSPWYPPRQVSSLVFAPAPRERQYCRHIFTATSTETEPESQRNACSSPSGASVTSRSARATAGSCVSPPNITWLIRPSWSRAAASSTGCRYPWIAAHQELMPSISSRPSASRSRTPLADSTTSGSRVPGIGAYGCHTRCRSSSSSFPGEGMKTISALLAVICGQAGGPRSCRAFRAAASSA